MRKWWLAIIPLVLILFAIAAIFFGKKSVLKTQLSKIPVVGETISSLGGGSLESTSENIRILDESMTYSATLLISESKESYLLGLFPGLFETKFQKLVIVITEQKQAISSSEKNKEGVNEPAYGFQTEVEGTTLITKIFIHPQLTTKFNVSYENLSTTAERMLFTALRREELRQASNFQNEDENLKAAILQDASYVQSLHYLYPEGILKIEYE